MAGVAGGGVNAIPSSNESWNLSFTAFIKFFERLVIRLSKLASSVIINRWIWDPIRDIFVFKLNKSL